MATTEIVGSVYTLYSVTEDQGAAEQGTTTDIAGNVYTLYSVTAGQRSTDDGELP